MSNGAIRRYHRRMVAIPIRCECGAVRGRLRDARPGTVVRLVCYCKDCQAFAHYLGRVEATLSANGGTEICQVAPRMLGFERGAAELACLRLTSSGPLRWHTKCCKTPIGITPASRRLPFVGLVGDCFADAPAADVKAACGPVRMHIFKASATGDQRALDGLPGMQPARLLRLALRMGGALLTGRYRQNPFFEPGGAPVAPPHVVTDEERASLSPYSNAA